MRIRLNSTYELRPLVRAARKSEGLRQDATAEDIVMSENVLAEVERGETLMPAAHGLDECI